MYFRSPAEIVFVTRLLSKKYPTRRLAVPVAGGFAVRRLLRVSTSRTQFYLSLPRSFLKY